MTRRLLSMGPFVVRGTVGFNTEPEADSVPKSDSDNATIADTSAVKADALTPEVESALKDSIRNLVAGPETGDSGNDHLVGGASFTGQAPHTNSVRLYSTSVGRQRFPDILQEAYGDKSVVGFDRYGRALGALVPIEAVRLLAGFTSSVDDATKAKLKQTAIMLLEKLPAEAALCGLEPVAVRRRAKHTRRVAALQLDAEAPQQIIEPKVSAPKVHETKPREAKPLAPKHRTQKLVDISDVDARRRVARDHTKSLPAKPASKSGSAKAKKVIAEPAD